MARLGGGIGLHEEGEACPVNAVRYPGLGAVDEVVVALAFGDGADGLQIGAAIGLGQGQAAAQFARGEARQERALLRLGAETPDRSCHDEVRVEDAGQGHPHPRDALDDHGIDRGRKPEPAVVLGDGGAEEAELAHALDDLGGIEVVMLELVDMGLHVALEEALDAREDRVLDLLFRALCGVGHALNSEPARARVSIAHRVDPRAGVG